jgi:hypothetical protein
MQVSLLYFDGCPNWRETEQRLLAALVDSGAETGLTYVHVDTQGAPTVAQLREALEVG